MDYILDASVVIEYLITDTYTPQARHFFSGLSAFDRLTVPEFCLLECTNVIWKQIRFFGMPQPDADKLMTILRMMKLRRVPMKNLLNRTLHIAVKHQLAAYDSGYIALALHYGYPLVTLDQRQLQAATSEGVTVIHL